VGLFCGIFQGIAFDRYGPRTATLLATALLAGGYLTAYIVSSMSTAPPLFFAAAFFMIGQGSQ